MNISDINKYKKFIENGSYVNTTIEKMADRYNQQYNSAVSHLDVLFQSDRANIILKDGVEYKCLVDYGFSQKKSSNMRNMHQKELWTQHSDNIAPGDVVEFTHNNERFQQKSYFILNTIETKHGYRLSVMQPTISTLKWLNKNGIVREVYFTYKTDIETNFGVQDGRIISVGNERRSLLIKETVETLKITKEHRFIFDNRAWIVTAIDTLSMDGLVNLTLDETSIDPANDNISLRIANYTPPTYKINIKGGDVISLNAGNTRQLSTEIFKNNILVSGLDVIWDSSNSSIATIDDKGLLTTTANGSVTITARLAELPNVLDTIVVKVEFPAVNHIAVLINGPEVITVGNEGAYNITATNNGVVDATKQVQWYLFAENGSSATNKATFSLNQFTQCKIKTSVAGKIKLKCVVLGYPTVTYTKDITIKNLF